MPEGYYRYPTIHNDTVVFVCEDDLWTVAVDGGIARRLTSSRGEASRPLLSPDGSLLAFVGREEGSPEIYIMPARGGPARRLTYQGGKACQTSAWLDLDRLVFASNAEHWDISFTQLYTIDVRPEAVPEPQKMHYGLANTISFSPGDSPAGGAVLGRNTNDPARWKRYLGGTTGQIWIDREGSGEFQPLIELRGNLSSPMWVGERIYFISDHEGVGNLYSCRPDGEELHRHTDHERFYARNASSDGQRIVYHAGADLYCYTPGEADSRPIEVEFHSPQTQRNRRFVNPERYLGTWSIHPRGHSLAVTTRGKLFTFSNWEGAARQHSEVDELASSERLVTGARYRIPAWLNDGERLIAVTDVHGEENFVILHVDGSESPEHLTGLDTGRPMAIAVNPRKDQIAFSNHRYELMCLDLETRELTLVDRSKAYPMGGFDWSPDGEWLAYSASISLQVRIIKLWEAASGQIAPVTSPVLRDVAPSFDPYGKFLYFLSYRTFDPIHDSLQFDLNFPLGVKPYLVTLQKDTPSPFVPLSRLARQEITEEEEEPPEDEDEIRSEAAPRTEDREPEDAQAVEEPAELTTEAEKPEEEKEEDERIQIDLEGIQNRIIAFPVSEGRYGRIIGIRDGKVLYSSYPARGTLSRSNGSSTDGVLMMYDFGEQREETLLTGINGFDVSADRLMTILRAGNRLRVLRSGEKPIEERSLPGRRTGWIDLDRVKVSVVPGAEWRQMFREAWRLQRDQFWTSDMSQVDWIQIYERYLPLVDRVSSRAEFSDLMWEMQGELGTSHAYEFGGDYRPDPRYDQGFLGADFAFDPQTEQWRIARIHRGDSWDDESDSPFNAPGINLQPGDAILEINGRKLNRDRPPGAALVNLAEEEVILTVLPGPGEGADPAAPETRKSRSTYQVTVCTLRSERSLRYREWVEANRRKVHEATEGRAGYVHIPDMGGWGYAEFHRGYLAEVDREGLIVDVRFNNGGNVSGLLLEKLARRRIGYAVTRWGEIPFPYPDESVLGPMVAITNEFAGSDGDIFSHGFKMMNLGPLVGKRTWGGVVGTLSRRSLVDGTLTTQPEFSFWFYDVGWGVENYGTDPDIVVDITPQQYRRGEDSQLERAIQEVQRLLAETAPHLPDFSQRPSRALPSLPKRLSSKKSRRPATKSEPPRIEE